jgi:hypothetical protein
MLATRVAIVAAGALCGAGWWVVSWMLGAQQYGIWGSHAATGFTAGIVTGIVMAAMSVPVYRRLSRWSLYWFSPLSVYIAVALYGLAILTIRQGIDDFERDQIRWAVGVQSILGMWWGITILLPFAAAVQLLAYLNHRVLRRLLAVNAPHPEDRDG